jgi:hypothetical protein
VYLEGTLAGVWGKHVFGSCAKAWNSAEGAGNTRPYPLPRSISGSEDEDVLYPYTQTS